MDREIYLLIRKELFVCYITFLLINVVNLLGVKWNTTRIKEVGEEIG